MCRRMRRPGVTTRCIRALPRTAPPSSRRSAAARLRRDEAAMSRFSLFLLPAIGFALAGCRGWQSALDAQGPQASELAWLFWIFTWVLGAIWAAVMIALAAALLRSPASRPDPLLVNPAQDRRYAAVVASLAVATGVVVLVLTGLSVVSQRNLFRVEEEAVTIRVTGRQWWWEIRYEEADASR